MFKVYFENEEVMVESVLMGEVASLAEASALVEASDEEGGEALAVCSETGDEYYYCPSDDGDWFKLD